MANIITLKKGDSLKLNVVYKDSNNTPIDLTGFKLLFKVKDLKNINIISIDSAVNNPKSKIQFVDKVYGIFNILVIDTDNLPIGTFNADIQYIDADGIKQSSKSFGIKIVDKL